MQKLICKHCKREFLSRGKSFTCLECSKKDSDIFDKIETYLKEYPNSSALQIAEGLELDVYEIIKFMEEGRLIVTRGTFERL